MLFKAGDVGDFAAIDGDQPVAKFNSGFLAWAIDIHSLGAEVLSIFHPPDAIGWAKVLAVFLKIDGSKHDRRNAE